MITMTITILKRSHHLLFSIFSLVLLIFGFTFTLSSPLSAAEAVDLLWNSNLPLLHIDSQGTPFFREKKIKAKLSHLNVSEGNPSTPVYLFAPGIQVDEVEVRLRGNSSLRYPKKGYLIEYAKRHSLLGMNPGEEWALHGPYMDRSLIHNALAFYLGHLLSQTQGGLWYVPRFQFVELFVNHEYKGIYVLIEKIERGEGRLDIPKYDLENPELTTFIAKVDGFNDPANYYRTPSGTMITYVYPKLTKLKEMAARGKISLDQVNGMKEAIQMRMKKMEEAMKSEEYAVYSQQIGVQSFINFILIQELTKNFDGFRRSLFFHHPGDGRIHLGPLWDFDLAYGNTWPTRHFIPEGWLLGALPRLPIPPTIFNKEVFWFYRLLKEKEFVDELVNQYRLLRKPGHPLSDDVIFGTIEGMKNQLITGGATRRNFERWPVLGRPDRHFWLTPPPWPSTYEKEVEKLERWLKKRLKWVDQHIDDIGKI